jgi:hypothetical protein
MSKDPDPHFSWEKYGVDDLKAREEAEAKEATKLLAERAMKVVSFLAARVGDLVFVTSCWWAMNYWLAAWGHSLSWWGAVPFAFTPIRYRKYVFAAFLATVVARMIK